MFNNLNSTLKKVVVIFLIITLTYANLVLIGTNIVQGLFSYALEETEEQNLLVANQELVMNKVYGTDEEQTRIIQVAVETGIESEEYPIKGATLTLGTDLIETTLVDVKVTELNKNSYTSGTWKLSEEGKVIIYLVNENETLETKESGLDKFLVTYVFENSEVETIKQPLEKVEVTRYGEEVLTNECTVANFEDINVEKELLLLNIENKDIHKTTIESGKVDYTEKLNLDLSYRNETTSISIEDVSNNFYNIDGQENEEIVLQYKTTIINKEVLSNLLGEEGKLVITDTSTSKVVAEITSEILAVEGLIEQKFTDEETSEEEQRSNVTVGNETVEIEYIAEVTKLRLELVDIKVQSESEIDISNFIVQNTKSILNVSDVENLSYLQENIKYVVNEEKTAQSTINFKDTVTRAGLEVDNTEWVVGEANTVNYTITLDTTTEKSELFVNPMFLIELPSSVESINTANSQFTVSNDNGVFTSKKVFTTTVLNKKYVVIILTGEQTKESIQNGNTTINLSLELNVSSNETEGNEITKLYYQNDTVTAYESGNSFDTAQVTVNLIMESEPKEEIEEITDKISRVSMYLESSAEEIVKQDEEFSYTVKIYNYGEIEEQSLILTDVLPECITLQNVVEIVNDEEIETEYNYNEETRILSINIDKIDAATKGETNTYIKSGNRVFKIKVKADLLEDGIYSKEITNTVKLEQKNGTIIETEKTNIISDTFLVIETEPLEENINEKETINLVMKIMNKGLIDATNVNVQIIMPNEISLYMFITSLLSDTGEVENSRQGTLNSDYYEENNIEIPAGKTYYIQLKGNIGNIAETRHISIEGKVNEESFSWTTELVDVFEEDPENPVAPEEPEEPVVPEEPEDPEEPIAPEEPVVPEEPEEPIVPEEPEEPIAPEDPEEPIAPEDPEEPVDPEDPKKPEDTEKPEDKENPEDTVEGFDLSLSQYLNKIIVENSKGTTEYNYKDTNFAKIEIHSKYMDGSKVTLEYKMVIKNEGTIPGYARKIVNYKPEGLEFNQDLNKDWYVGDDGNIYSVALIDKILNPGETAELTIVLEKQMTDENIGTIVNTVEIYEASNDEELEDVNSIPGDKLEGQNDISIVEVMVVTSTGTIILYTTLIIAVIAIIVFGFYKVKKIILKGGC